MLHKEELLKDWDRASMKLPLNQIDPWSKFMIPHVIEAKYVNDYKVWVRSNDGLSGEIDLSTELDGPIFPAS